VTHLQAGALVIEVGVIAAIALIRFVLARGR
jgi:hypothetical protein